MAISKTINFLPEYFQSIPNDRFLSGTLDQLVAAPQIKRFDGYIGQRYINGEPLNGAYLTEPTPFRTNYQLEPNFVTTDQSQNIKNVVGFDDVLNVAQNKGAITNAWNRLLTDNLYSWRGFVDIDKVINFQDYCWMPQQSSAQSWFWNNPITINNANLNLAQSFSIVRSGAALYVNGSNYPNSPIVLQRGGTYQFNITLDSAVPQQRFANPLLQAGTANVTVDTNISYLNNTTGLFVQDSYLFSPASPNFNLDNNPWTVEAFIRPSEVTVESTICGIWNENVPSLSSWRLKTEYVLGQRLLVFEWVDPNTGINTLCSPMGIINNQWSHVAVSNAYGLLRLYINGIEVATSPEFEMVSNLQYDLSIGNDITGKSQFVGNQANLRISKGYARYTASTYSVPTGEFVNDNYTTLLILFSFATSTDQFFDSNTLSQGKLWIQASPGVTGDSLVNPTISTRSVQGVTNNGISGGIIEYQIPQNYNPQNQFEFEQLFNGADSVLYLQDDSMSSRVITLNIVDPITSAEPVNLDVTSILGQISYTTASGIEFVNGLHVTFDETAYPAPYNDTTKSWIVEGVGTSITLVPVSELIIPENLLLQGSPADYITINRASADLNPWSRSNQWFPTDTIQWTANYLINAGIITADVAIIPTPARRPIIEFFAGLNLFGMGSVALPAINLFDATTLDAFSDVEGAEAYLIDTVQVSQGDLIIFNADIHASIRQNIYQVNFINPNTTTVVNRLDPVLVMSTANITLSGLQTIDGIAVQSGDRVLVNNPYAQTTNGIYVAAVGNWELSSDFNPAVSSGVYVEQGQIYNSTYFNFTGAVSNNINFVQSTNIPIINLTLFSGAVHGSCTTTKEGSTYLNTPLVWNSTTSRWAVASQLKTGVQQQPKFDLVDASGNSFSTYTESTFTGSELFSYALNSNNPLDPVLGLPVVYGDVGNLSDLTFNNNYETDIFSYRPSSVLSTPVNVNTGVTIFVDPITNIIGTYDPWMYVDCKQELYQNIEVTGKTEIQLVGKLLVKTNLNSQPTQVYVDGIQLNADEFTVAQILNGTTYLINIVINVPVFSTSNVLIKILSSTTIPGAYYDVPSTFENNPFGLAMPTFNTAQLRNHAEITAANNIKTVTNFNLNQVIYNNTPGSIVIHEASSLLPTLLLTNSKYDIDKAIKNAADDYVLFRQKFLQASTQINNISNLSTKIGVDSVFAVINAAQSSSTPWYTSDMVPIGGAVTSYTIVNDGQTIFTVQKIHNMQGANNIGLLVYRTNIDGTITQLVNGIDYTPSNTRAVVTMLNVPVAGQILSFYEMSNTDGCCVPATPTKLGLAPAYLPQIFTDNTYVYPRTVIQGHDGSITQAYGDFRDQLLLDLELRIYNNLKVNNQLWSDVIETNVPTANRFKNELRINNDEIGPYSLNEQIAIQGNAFYEWAAKYQVDYAASVYTSSDPFTWNWCGNVDLFGDLPQSILLGGWRGIYNYFFNTIRPHVTPWEMLNLSVKPVWWDTVYGPAPYTGTNLVLWNDLQAGIIRDPAGVKYSTYGPRVFAGGNLLSVIPVDESGNLLDPSSCLVANLNNTNTSSNYVFGDGGPAETAWRNSPYYPFAKLRAQILQNPMFMCGMLWDLDNYMPTVGAQQFRYNGILPAAQSQIQLNQVDVVNGTPVRKNSILNYTLEYLRKQGCNPAILRQDLNNTTVNLVHDLAGFADVNNMSVYADQSTATQGSTINIIPVEDYNLFLSENSPAAQLVYSGVIISGTAQGFKITGYDLAAPFFTILPENADSAITPLSVGNNNYIVYSEYSLIPKTVPYNSIFPDVQAVVNFIIAYGRYLESVGLTFSDNAALDQITWVNAAAQFVQWTYENWSLSQSGQTLSLVLNPATSKIKYTGSAGTLQNLLNTEQNSIIDTNQNLIGAKYLDVLRQGNTVTIQTLDQTVIAGLHVNIINYEHKLVLNNTTVFGDIIYEPVSGIRQYRLRIAGQKTANWNGSLDMPGFMLLTDSVPDWQPLVDYPSGSIVSFKNANYMALVNVIGANTFQYTQFTKIDDIFTNSIVPNLNLKAQDYANAYNSEYRNYITDFVRLRGSMLGYKGMDWLNNLGIDYASQTDFYRGWIKEKGSLNSVQAYSRATTSELNTAATINEEYAVRVGEYGSTDNTGFADAALPNNTTANAVVNPLVVTYTGLIDATDTRTIQVTPNNLFNKSDNFITDFIQPQGMLKTTTVGFQQAGPVLPQDILSTANIRVGSLSSEDYTSLYFSNIADFCTANSIIQNSILKIGTGGGVFWIANDNTLKEVNNWNVLRFVQTSAGVIGVQQIDESTVALILTEDINATVGQTVLLNINDEVTGVIIQGVFPIANYVVAPTDSSTATLYITTSIGQFSVGTVSLATTADQYSPGETNTLPSTVVYNSKSLRFRTIGEANTNVVPNTFNLPIETNLFVDADQNGWASYNYIEPYTSAVSPVNIATDGTSQAVGYDADNSLLWVGKPDANNAGEVVAKQIYNYVSAGGNVLPTINIDSDSISAGRNDSYDIGYNIQSLNNLSAAISANTANTGIGQIYIMSWNSTELPDRIRIQQILSADGFASPGPAPTIGPINGSNAADTYLGGASWANVSYAAAGVLGSYATVNLTPPQYIFSGRTANASSGTGQPWANASYINNSSLYTSVNITQLLNTYSVLSINSSNTTNFFVGVTPLNNIEVNDKLYFSETGTSLDNFQFTVSNVNDGNVTLSALSNININAGQAGKITDISTTTSNVSQLLTANILSLTLPSNVAISGISYNFSAYYSGSNVQPELKSKLNIDANTYITSLTTVPQKYYFGGMTNLSNSNILSLPNLSVSFCATTSDSSANITTVYINNLIGYVYYSTITTQNSNNFVGVNTGNGTPWTNLTSINTVSSYSSVNFIAPVNSFGVNSAVVIQTLSETT